MAPKSLMRARHVISENLRTMAAAEALLKGDLAELGRLMADAMVALAQDLPGLIGARLTGGGFGGCTVNVVEQTQAPAFAEALGKRYTAQFGIVPQIHICHASGGAHRLE